MKLNPLVASVAVLYAAAGLALTFAPGEVVSGLGGAEGSVETWAGQMTGAGLISLAILNWAQRYAVVAGVLGRPLLLANMLFAAAGAGASLSAWRGTQGVTALVAACALGAIGFLFALRLFRPPAAN